MDIYDPETVFSSIDRQGRYAYGNQSRIAHWNLARLAETFVPLLDDDETRGVEIAKDILGIFPERFESHWLGGMREKLGLFNAESEDLGLAGELLEIMAREQWDFTNTFRNLNPAAEAPELGAWHAKWKARLSRQPQPIEDALARMRQSNPVVIPRNHRVEEALAAAVDSGDLCPMHRLLEALAKPFEDNPEKQGYRDRGPLNCEPYQTFCGT
jgi:uncharacterized protein YdiU (UPF0061 family)